jgi:hypothetical protein
MNTWEDDKAWSDRFIPAVGQIIGPRLLVPAPLVLDIREATDLIVLQARDLRIAVRLRRAHYADRYPNQVTIRSSRSSGVKTELAKIYEGWVDWMFYGYAHEISGRVYPWYLINLRLFIAAIVNNPSLKNTMKEMTNRDGTRFVAVMLDAFPQNILIAKSDPPPTATVSQTTMQLPVPPRLRWNINAAC